mmetsp:Transcript_9068/g.25274  ORF Transcript_9068/g.25274 Transcript_9068/m.25274 type:complete len:307 (+) Transcript_9068:1090-2010(+)
MFARTISADAGPFATSNETSNWNPLGRSSNLTMGTLALAMSWIFLAIPLRDNDSASALRHVAGDLHPLPKMTASMSEFGRYMPVANDPCTSNRAPGQMDATASRTRSTAADRAADSASVGSRYRQKSTISWCRRISGDFTRASLSAVPAGHHRGSAFGSSSPAAQASCRSPSPSAPASSSSSSAGMFTSGASWMASSGRSGSSSKSMKSSPRPVSVTGRIACRVAPPPMRTPDASPSSSFKFDPLGLPPSTAVAAVGAAGWTPPRPRPRPRVGSPRPRPPARGRYVMAGSLFESLGISMYFSNLFL